MVPSILAPCARRLIIVALAFVLAGDALADDHGGWGEFIDPDGDCAASFRQDVVTLDVPGTSHDLSAEIGTDNAPRILRDIDGDFIATVRVAGAVQPVGPSTVPGRKAYQGAGLLLWLDDGTYVRLERGSLIQPDTAGLQYFVTFELRRNGALVSASGALTADEPLHLRLERRGGRVVGALSRDGLHWRGFKPLDLGLDAPVRIGVAAINSGSNGFTAEFENFSLFTRAHLGDR